MNEEFSKMRPKERKATPPKTREVRHSPAKQVSEFVVRLACPPSEVSAEFIQGMADRMAVSFYKYGPVARNYPTPIHAIDSLRRRLSKYDEDGNIEWLMDVANFAMIEYMRPAHSEAHFKATESQESPGLQTWSGESTQDPERLRDET